MTLVEMTFVKKRFVICCHKTGEPGGASSLPVVKSELSYTPCPAAHGVVSFRGPFTSKPKAMAQVAARGLPSI